MSDFIFTNTKQVHGYLAKELQAIYHVDPPDITEYHGDWGSIAVTKNIYNGFQVYENTEHICVVIGGPVLCFQNNKFITGNDIVAGTTSIYNRWLTNLIQWDEDISGPFVFLVIDKSTNDITCVTDLMSFVPVFVCQDKANVILSTHVDVLARISKQQRELDFISQVDFILHGLVTYPYTFYSNIRQIAPASIHTLIAESCIFKYSSYWLPKENHQSESIKETANYLRNSLQNYVNSIAEEMPVIAQFISGGEDSRTLSALLPQKSQRDAYIFLDSMNREGKLAKQTANAYGASFNLATRSVTHYIDILPACADLVGSGAEFHHVHTFGFHKSCKLNKYPAVFGGFMSDTLLKGLKIKKTHFTKRFNFLPQIKQRKFSPANIVSNKIFSDDVLLEVTKRRRDHLQFIKGFRYESAEEWFYLWPITMQTEIPNVHGNRRLFRSYEPFMSKEVVKISAKAQQSWKLNRRLFHKAAKPLLYRTKWLLHGDGYLPYFSWWVNMPIKFVIWTWRKIGIRTGVIKGNQGPWRDWNLVMKSEQFHQALLNYAKGFSTISGVTLADNSEQIFNGKDLDIKQKINLLQVMYFLNKFTPNDKDID
ncbi:hypothetical protein [Methylotuvimicrobium sp.]|uniref:hypothetical protein n=1 Tax=Methylotuvimicrobium sp. TaxID=2822413 RepID=UPI003D655593